MMICAASDSRVHIPYTSEVATISMMTFHFSSPRSWLRMQTRRRALCWISWDGVMHALALRANHLKINFRFWDATWT